jgi:membrane protease YdiL (CAAX protease family)
MKFTRRAKAAEELNLSQFDRKHLKLGLIFGLISFFVIFIAYFIFKGTINFNDIVSDLRDKNITPANFIFIGLYITFGNSFLEEFFFRGFIFLNLYNMKRVKLAYTYSSLLFGLYHIAIFKTWFSLWMIMLCLLGLIVIGFVFDWLDTKSDNFINSWIVHILADSAIILIGLRMFEII